MKYLLLAARVVVPLLLLAAGVGIMVALVQSKPSAARKPVEVQAPLVEVREVSPSTEAVTVKAMGTIKPARSMVVMPQVSGVVVAHHEALVEGGFVRASEELIRIDDRDYKLAVSQLRAQVKRAEVERRVEGGRRKVAEREWATMEGTLAARPGGESDRDLALRDPQIQAADASIASARSAVKSAKLGLERTVIKAPMDALVSAESVEVGQLVGPQSQLAKLIGTDEAWVEVSVPVDRLPWIAIPGTNASEGAPVVITHDAGPALRIERHGTVLRLLHELSPEGRMARLLVSVADPFDRQRETAERGLPLLLGAFVRVAIRGHALEDAIAVPRTALHDGDHVWIVDGDSRLQIRPVGVAWREKDRVLVDKGLQAGDRLVVSDLAAPVAGMELRVRGPATAHSVPAEHGAEP